MAFVTDIKTFAALGSGVIGSGWVARALAHGLDVLAWDPAPGAEAQLRGRIDKCWGALQRKGLAAGASKERLRFVPTIEECVKDADFIQESAPEVLELKRELHAKISASARADVLIGSSTSGLLPSEFYARATHSARCVVGHPFNPVYLLPLVELVGGQRRALALQGVGVALQGRALGREFRLGLRAELLQAGNVGLADGRVSQGLIVGEDAQARDRRTRRGGHGRSRGGGGRRGRRRSGGRCGQDGTGGSGHEQGGDGQGAMNVHGSFLELSGR